MILPCPARMTGPMSPAGSAAAPPGCVSARTVIDAPATTIFPSGWRAIAVANSVGSKSGPRSPRPSHRRNRPPCPPGQKPLDEHVEPAGDELLIPATRTWRSGCEASAAPDSWVPKFGRDAPLPIPVRRSNAALPGCGSAATKKAGLPAASVFVPATTIFPSGWIATALASSREPRSGREKPVPDPYDRSRSPGVADATPTKRQEPGPPPRKVARAWARGKPNRLVTNGTTTAGRLGPTGSAYCPDGGGGDAGGGSIALSAIGVVPAWPACPPVR